MKYLKHFMMLLTEKCKKENPHAKDVHYLHRKHLLLRLSSAQLKKETIIRKCAFQNINHGKEF